MPAANKFRALFSTGVWGEEYIDRFLNYSLRTQLSSGNFGAFDKDSLCHIVTDQAGYNQIVASPVYAAAAKLVSVECVVDDAISHRGETGKYDLITTCQNVALARSRDFDVIFFGYADALWSDGSYRNAAKRIAENYDVVFSFGYNVLDVPFKKFVDKIGARQRGEARRLAARPFAAGILEHLHPMTKANNWHARFMTHCPSYVLWEIPGEGLLVRAFHLHPVAIRVLKDKPEFFSPMQPTLDEAFVSRLHRQIQKSYVSYSTDEICVCSLAADTGLSYRMMPVRPVNFSDLARFAEGSAGLLHRENFSQAHRLITTDPTNDEWSSAECEAETVVREVHRRLSIPDSILRIEDPAAYAARQGRTRAATAAESPDSILRIEDPAAHGARQELTEPVTAAESPDSILRIEDPAAYAARQWRIKPGAQPSRRRVGLRLTTRLQAATTPVVTFLDRLGSLKAFKRVVYPHLSSGAQGWIARQTSPYYPALMEQRVRLGQGSETNRSMAARLYSATIPAVKFLGRLGLLRAGRFFSSDLSPKSRSGLRAKPRPTVPY